MKVPSSAPLLLHCRASCQAAQRPPQPQAFKIFVCMICTTLSCCWTYGLTHVLARIANSPWLTGRQELPSPQMLGGLAATKHKRSLIQAGHNAVSRPGKRWRCTGQQRRHYALVYTAALELPPSLPRLPGEKSSLTGAAGVCFPVHAASWCNPPAVPGCSAWPAPAWQPACIDMRPLLQCACIHNSSIMLPVLPVHF